MGKVMLRTCPLNFQSGRSGTEGACTLNVTAPYVSGERERERERERDSVCESVNYYHLWISE